MNCSQIQLNAFSTWKTASSSVQSVRQQPDVLVTESIRWTDSPEKLGMDESRWAELRSWAVKLTVTPHLKPAA